MEKLYNLILVVSQMRLYGENIIDAIIIPKVLWNLTSKYNYIVTAIKETKYRVFSFHKLISSLLMRQTK